MCNLILTITYICIYLCMAKKKNMGRPLLYGEQTIVFPGFYCPISKKDEMDELIKAKLKTFEVKKNEPPICSSECYDELMNNLSKYYPPHFKVSEIKEEKKA